MDEKIPGESNVIQGVFGKNRQTKERLRRPEVKTIKNNVLNFGSSEIEPQISSGILEGGLSKNGLITFAYKPKSAGMFSWTIKALHFEKLERSMVKTKKLDPEMINTSLIIWNKVAKKKGISSLIRIAVFSNQDQWNRTPELYYALMKVLEKYLEPNNPEVA